MLLTDLLPHRFVVPSVPRVVALLLPELASEQPSLRRIDQLICTDPALGLRLLQAANAPFFNLSGKIHSVSEALAVLRLAQVQAMVSQAVGQTTLTQWPGLSMGTFWAVSLDAARVARSLAGLLRLNPQAAYTCGLIHAVGELLMRSAMPEAVALDQTCPPLRLRRLRMERAKLGFGYTQATAGLVNQWHLPQVMVDALAHAHAPFDRDAYEPLAGVLQLAIWRATTRQARYSPNALAVSFPGPVAEVLGLDIDMVLQQDPVDWSQQVPGETFANLARAAT
jgi:HD-like signal output (HDOD) protein